MPAQDPRLSMGHFLQSLRNLLPIDLGPIGAVLSEMPAAGINSPAPGGVKRRGKGVTGALAWGDEPGVATFSDL